MYIAQINTPTPFINPTIFPAARFSTISSLLNIIIPNLMIGAAIIFFIMMIVGGFTYMNSEGQAEKIKKAQQLFVYSIIGFSIVLVSFLAVKLIGSVFNITDLPF